MTHKTSMVIGPGTGHCFGNVIDYSGSFATGNPTASMIHYYPLQVYEDTVIVKGGTYVTTGIGASTANVGIYSSAGSRLAETGNFATATSAAWAGATISYTLSAHTLYYMALICSAAITISNWPHIASGNEAGDAAGCFQEAGATSVLPSTATFAEWAQAGIWNFVLSTHATLPI